MEKVVEKQVRKYFEEKNLLPMQQHGFRQGRSTVTALTSMMSDWVCNYENGRHTGALLWDLSAAFDTIDTDIFCKKLEIYGADRRTIEWFRSFLSDREQRVVVGSAQSEPVSSLSIGCPQGSLLSPLIFLIYVADMELWVDQVRLNSFADDTISSYSSSDENDVIDKLQADSTNLLRFMASNALVANPKKTGFLLIRSGAMSESKSITVGNETIKEESKHKILGMVVDNRLKWDEHVYGQNGVLSAVNKRVGVLRRLSNYIPRKYLPQIATAIVSSKIRYGLGIYGTVRTNNRDPHDNHQKDLQIVLNKAMRLVTGKKLSDRVSINDLCTESGMVSVNRMSAIDKISLTWNSEQPEISAS